jgi:DNA-binding response OmpR family regulator
MKACSVCARTLAERDELAERVRQLEELLLDHGWVPEAWGLTASENTLLNVLALRRLASKEALHLALYGNDPDGGAAIKIIDVMVHKLRRKLAAQDIQIETVWGMGYRLSDETRLYLTQLWKAVA